MSIAKYELYHGAVLTQIVRNPKKLSLKLIERNKDEHGWAMYSISAGKEDYILFVKTTGKITQGRKDRYCNFTFSLGDIELLNRYKDKKLLVVLVCGEEQICLLTRKEVAFLRILESSKSCNVTVSWSRGSQLSVKSSYARLGYKIARSALRNYQWL